MPGVLVFFATVTSVVLMLNHIAVSSVSESYMVRSGQELDAAWFGKYQMFVAHAKAYMEANPGATGSIYWDTIKTGANVPEGAKLAVMPSDWRIVANGSSYVICTRFPNERSAILANQMLQNRTEKLVRVSNNAFVIGDPTNPSALQTEAAKCN